MIYQLGTKSRIENCNVSLLLATNRMKAAFNTDGKGVGTTADMDSIYREYSGTVKAFLIRISGNTDLAEELTQETFYQAIKSINRFDGKSSLRTWLCSIAKHQYLDAIRKRNTNQPVFDNHSAEEDFTERLAKKDQALAAHRLLHLLVEPYREVFTLRTFCDLTHAQIADLFGKSESWSRVTYYRARQQLQDAMKENENEEK